MYTYMNRRIQTYARGSDILLVRFCISIATNLTTLVIVVLWVSSTISNTISTKIPARIRSSTTNSSLRIVSMRETLETKLESLKYG